jgi:hypothetical protein
VKSKPRPKSRPKPRPKGAGKPAARRLAVNGRADADPLADARIRPLLERYCQLAGVKQSGLAADHSELSLPLAERPFFRDRKALRVAFSLDALERDPDAEIAVLGSPFLSQVIEAIRARAARLSLGLIAPAGTGDQKSVELTIPVRDGTAKPGRTLLALHPLGRLVARVVLRAGAGVEEAVVESDVYDLSAGAKVGDDLAGAFRELEAGRVKPADPSEAGTAARVPAREPGDLLRLLLSHLQEKSAERVAARRAVAEKDLALELARLDRYFESILKEQTDPESIGTVTALAERRRTEEIRRSQVKAVVHPLQLIEATVLIQRAEWQLESSQGRHASFSAQRSLSRAADWIMACPHCGRPPASLVVCRHEHARSAAPSAPRTSAATTGSRSAAWTGCRHATSTCAYVRRVGSSTVLRTRASAPRMVTTRARRASRCAAAAGGSCATGTRSRATRRRRRAVAVSARCACGIARVGPASQWAWTR